MTLTLPLTVTLPRKTTADKKISLSLNWYRNAKFFQSNDAKQIFKAAVHAEVVRAGLNKLPVPAHFKYRYFFARKSDVGNFHAVIEKFLLDALVELGVLPEDNCEVVPGGEYRFAGYDKTSPRVELEIV